MEAVKAVQKIVERSGYGLRGFPELYDTYRPRPPTAIVDILTQLAGTPRPRMVIDFGSGTGLSTRLWAGRADLVIGIEPNGEVRTFAQSRTPSYVEGTATSYQEGSSARTELPADCADIITCGQALHWMPPRPTFLEIANILRREGVFGAYDYSWPPAVHWEIEAAYHRFLTKFRSACESRGFDRGIKLQDKNQHLARIQESGLFRYAREFSVHKVEMGDAERFLGLVLSRGPVFTLLSRGATEEEVGLIELQETAERILGQESRPMYFSYRLWIAVK